MARDVAGDQGHGGVPCLDRGGQILLLVLQQKQGLVAGLLQTGGDIAEGQRFVDRAVLKEENPHCPRIGHAAARNAGLRQFGLDFSTAFFDLDIRGEVAVSNKVQTAFFEGTLSPEFSESMLNGVPNLDEFPELVGRKKDWIVQAVLGAELAVKYSDEDSLILGLEYFFNDAGYDESSIYPWLIAVASPDIQTSLNSIDYADGRLSNFDTASSFKPLYVGRHYLALSAILMAPGSWNNTTLVLSGLCNLSDKSLIVRGDYRIRLLTQLDLGAYVTVHTGNSGEFRMNIPMANDDGSLSLTAQLVDIGASLRVYF